MYESLKNRIAALEEEEEVVEEEERRFGARIYNNPPSTFRIHFESYDESTLFGTTAEEAQKHVRGLEENTVHVKYIELVRAHCCSFAPCDCVLSTNSLQSSNAWSVSIRRRSRSCLKTRTLVGPPCIHSIHNSHAGFRCSEKPTYEG